MPLEIDQKLLIKQLVFNKCAEDPSFVPEVIVAATEGVKEFASKQSDTSSKLAFMMSQILEQHDNGEFGVFKRGEILDCIGPWLDGTPWMTKQRSKSK